MIKCAQISDLDSIMSLCAMVTQDMKKKGIDQWDALYPTREIFSADINMGAVYAYWQNRDLLGVIVLNQEEEPEYQAVSWVYRSEPVGIVHRLMVNPRMQRKGVASKLLRFAEKLAAEQGMVALRLDVFKQNKEAVRFYEKRGYQQAGSVVFRKGEFICMEKHLD